MAYVQTDTQSRCQVSTTDGRRDGPALSLQSVAHLPLWATNVDTNTNRVTTFLAAHPGQFYCNGCLHIEAVPGLNRPQVARLTRRLCDVKPYRWGKVVCVSCGAVRECIAYGLRRDQLSRAQARQLGATARKRGRPIYENPCLGDCVKAWREGWQGVPLAADEARSRFTSFAAELYDYLVRHDQAEGLKVREITEGFVEQGAVKVSNGLSRLHRKGLVRRMLLKIAGQRHKPQRYRAVRIPAGEGA